MNLPREWKKGRLWWFQKMMAHLRAWIKGYSQASRLNKLRVTAEQWMEFELRLTVWLAVYWLWRSLNKDVSEVYYAWGPRLNPVAIIFRCQCTLFFSTPSKPRSDGSVPMFCFVRCMEVELRKGPLLLFESCCLRQHLSSSWMMNLLSRDSRLVDKGRTMQCRPVEEECKVFEKSKRE